MNQTIINLLELSYTSYDTQTVKAVTQQLFSFAPLQGFLPALMEISTSATTDHNLTIAALSQLKNCVRRFWHSNRAYENICLNKNDKQYLKNNILAFNIALSDNDKYGKIIKDIITNIGDALYGNIDQVITMLCNGQELRTCLNFLLGTVDFFRCHEDYEEEFRQKFNSFVCLSVPALTKLIIEAQKQLNNLYEMMQVNPTQEMIQNYKSQSTFMQQIMYLSIKSMSKIIEKDIPIEIRQYVFQWGQLCLNRLNDTNQQMHNRIRQEQNTFWPKRSEIFIYFHGRKWAIEYLYRFLNRILVYKKSQPLISQQTKNFYDTHLNTLTSIIKNLFMHFQTSKIRVRQLKLLQKLFAIKPKHMKEFLPFYLFQVLPNYIYFDQEDYNLANNPIQYLGYEEESENRVYQSDNLRAVAAGLWVELTKDYSQRQQKDKIQILSLSLQYIFRLLQSNEKRHQLAGVYLMQKLSSKIKMQETRMIIQAITSLTNFILQHFLRCKDLLLQSKTLEVFIANNKIISYPVRKYVFEFVLDVLEKQALVHTPQLIKINAILAMQMFQKEQLAMIDQLKIQDLIEIYLDMIMIYELENITVSFRLFMDRLSERAMPHSIFVIKHLRQIIKTIDIKSNQFQNKRFQIFKITNKNGVWNIAIQTLSVLSQLIKPQTVELKAALEEQLQLLLSMYFSVELDEENPIVELSFSIFGFLNSYIEIIKNNRLILPSCLKFYLLVFILKMTKLPRMFLVQTQQQLPYSPQQIHIIESCCHHQQYMIFDIFKSMKLLLSFLRVDLPMKGLNEIRGNLLRSNELEQFFHMIFSQYIKTTDQAPNYFDALEEYKGRIIVTLLLIYFVEQHYQQLTRPHYHNTLQILKLNQKKEQIKKYVSRYNRQLFYIWFWAFCPMYLIEKDIQYKQKITKYVIHVLKSISTEELKTTFFEQKRRILLGYSSLLLATIFIPQIKVYQDKVIGMLFAIMKKILYYTGVLCQEDYEEQTLETIRNYNQIRENMSNQVFNKDQNVKSEEPFSDEPNYLIELSNKDNDQFELFDEELERDFDPESIYDAEYQSKLDTTITNEFLPFFESLKNFQKYDPQGYRQKIHQTQYGILLNEMIEANVRSSNAYKLYQNIMNNSQESNG